MTKRLAAILRSRAAWRSLAVALLCAWVALAPSLAEARAGSSSGAGSSMGSRGSRTYSNNGAAPMERSVTPTPAPSQPSFAPRPSPMAPAYGGGFMQRNPFMTGLLGGFLGAGLAGMLFGHSAYAADGSGFGSMLGMLLQFALIGGLIWLAVAFFRRRGGLATAPGMFSGAASGAAGAMAAPTAARDPVEIPISEADFNAWSDLLVGIQGAWSKGDLAALRRYVTPEMLSYFSEELARNVSDGVENRVERVTLLKGDLQEAWSEGELEFATARLRWSAVDYMVALPQANGPQPNGSGQEVVVRGDPSRPTEATEVWTFVRSHGGRWLLSAIQQV
ncbi:MAG TPA: TIM44-like domain-containing protein [Stellaceae bacterium]|nr:TIM44-like domain-containing protein [Stellaceae bacterium]